MPCQTHLALAGKHVAYHKYNEAVSCTSYGLHSTSQRHAGLSPALLAGQNDDISFASSFPSVIPYHLSMLGNSGQTSQAVRPLVGSLGLSLFVFVLGEACWAT